MVNITNLLEFLRVFIGIYEPQMTTIYLPIESVDATGAVYISGYESYEVMATGIASFNIEYIITAFILVAVLWLIVNQWAWLFNNLFSKRNIKMAKKN